MSLRSKVTLDSIVAAAQRIVWQLIHPELSNPIEHDTTTSLTSSFRATSWPSLNSIYAQSMKKRNKFSFFSPSKLIAKIYLYSQWGRWPTASPHAGPCLLWWVLQCKYQIWTNNDSFSLVYDGSVHLQFCLHTFLSTDDPGSGRRAISNQCALKIPVLPLHNIHSAVRRDWPLSLLSSSGPCPGQVRFRKVRDSLN